MVLQEPRSEVEVRLSKLFLGDNTDEGGLVPSVYMAESTGPQQRGMNTEDGEQKDATYPGTNNEN